MRTKELFMIQQNDISEKNLIIFTKTGRYDKTQETGRWVRFL